MITFLIDAVIPVDFACAPPTIATFCVALTERLHTGTVVCVVEDPYVSALAAGNVAPELEVPGPFVDPHMVAICHYGSSWPCIERDRQCLHPNGVNPYQLIATALVVCAGGTSMHYLLADTSDRKQLGKFLHLRAIL